MACRVLLTCVALFWASTAEQALANLLPGSSAGGTLTASPSPAQVAEQVKFTYNNPNARNLDLFKLDFGDGQSVFIHAKDFATHLYQAPGNYPVRVMAGTTQLVAIYLPVAAKAWYLTVTPQLVLFGNPVTFTLVAPGSMHQSYPILFGDEEVSEAGPGIRRIESSVTIPANGKVTHTYKQFGNFLARVGDPPRDSAAVRVLPPGGADLGGWALEALLQSPAVGQVETFVLFAPASANRNCSLWFGDESGGPAGLPVTTTQIHTHSVATHRYASFGQFRVRVGAPCQSQPLMLTVHQ